MSAIRYAAHDFSSLSASELYDILALRQRVFLVEQKRFYQDCDGRDREAIFVTAHDGETLCACLRILPPGMTYDTAAIGRVAVTDTHRGQGIGEKLMEKALVEITRRYGGGATLSAQVETQKFYEKLGFTAVGEPYEEAFVPHIKMKFSYKL